ncbi:MAG: cysteine desulfurase [Actinomycetota bacterium]|nr:cysteine desulfurase [Actinomycetota bacterium]MDK1017658.1 cysteine desulfurase [Actinomycetota bacterium]MDK1027541.1 cysteine desulfurase [Actinomycetota bacterium]MDK1038919.1 cysteine desulfurase [Actinomycetota bacterium]MDK1097644.1 cysteine desulfurase [Actinomycetota bacterium]
MTDLRALRADFPILEREVNGHQLVYLDSAATTQKPQSVLDAMDDYYRFHNANVHRGAHTLAVEATEMYEGARAKVAGFIGAETDQLVFTRGTTTALNYIAYGWGLNHLKAGDKILVTVMEHHANLVPWQLISRYTGAELVYLELNDDLTVDVSSLDQILTDDIAIIAFSGMSNVTGALGPIDVLTDAARSVGAISVLDGAQLVPHTPVDVTELGVDFLAFSAHKMLGPTGIGALWGRAERLEEMEPTEGGGEMINTVDRHSSTWAPVPHKFEAGTPPIAEAVGFGAAVDYLDAVGMDVIAAHEGELTAIALERLSEIPDLTIYGPKDITKRGGAVSFELGDVHPHDIATILDQDGIAVRAGHHCAKPLMKYLNIPATARASFYLYNVPEEVDALVESLHKARKLFGLT